MGGADVLIFWRATIMSTSLPIANFDRAEFHGDPPPPDQCAYCQRGIETEYFRVDGNMACESCAQQAQSLIPPDSHKAYTKALIFGIGAAIVGCAGYALVTILTGWTIGYAAIGVGYLVGKAMMRGSRGLGGKRYQITAAVLTYAAVALAFIPMVMHANSKERESKPAVTQQSGSSAASADAASQGTSAAKKPIGIGGFFVAVLMLLGIGLVSPFLEIVSSPGGGLIGLFIIFIGISTAWRLTHKPTSLVEGPYENVPARV